MSIRPIYLDNHATTPTDPRVAEIVVDCMTRRFGNASSVDHVLGDEATAIVATAAEEVGRLIGASPEQIVFTSGATESSNLALRGLLMEATNRIRGARAFRVGLMPVEHPSVLETCQALQDDGVAELTFFRVDEQARLDLDDYEAKCRSGLDLVAVMAANNEVGTIYPVETAAALARNHGAVFFCDATQAAGRVPINVSAWGVHMLSLSAHKMYGPKGIGALVLADSLRLQPILRGGGHQRKLRPGTLNVPGIAGFGAACRLRSEEMGVDETRIGSQRDALYEEIATAIDGVVVNGDIDQRLAGNLHISVPVPSKAVIARIRKTVAVSTGSACSSGIEAPSHVLRAMALPAARLDGALRFGVGKFNTDADIMTAARTVASAVSDAHRMLSCYSSRA